MTIAIVLRKMQTTNLFRDLLIASLNSGQGDTAILCSGFFQETPIYTASGTPGLISSLANIQLHTVGVYTGGWKAQYIKFRDNLVSKGASVTAWYSSSFRWHAKIFILIRKGDPIFGIIGSSNITRRAFSTIGKDFNYECDVVLWDDCNRSLNDEMEKITANANYAAGIIRAPYIPALNSNLSLAKRLTTLGQEIGASGIKLLP